MYTNIVRKHEAHEIVAALKALAADLGRTPKRDEFRSRYGMEKGARRHFGDYEGALKAAGLRDGATSAAASTTSSGGEPSGKPGKFKYQPTKIDSFTVHERPLKELFALAGNPPVLKMVGQPDTHVPYHDETALRAFLSFCRWY